MPLFSIAAYLNWDIIIVPAAVLFALFLFHWMYKNGFTAKTITVHGIIFLAALFIGFFFSHSGINKVRQDESRTYMSILLEAAATVEKLKHSEINENTLADSPVLAEIQHYFNSLSSFPFIGQIYTLRKNQDDANVLTKIVSSRDTVLNTEIKLTSFIEGAFIRDSIDSTAHAINLSDHNFREKNGYYFIAAAPLKDRNSKTEAILVIDFMEESGFMANCFSLLLVLFLALYFCSTWFFVYAKVYQKKIRQNEDNLAAARKLSQAAVKAKGEFLSSVSHEVRTPMNALLGFSNILVQRIENVCPPEVVEESKGIFEIIQKSGQNLLTIINDILDYSRIESNLLQIESVPLSIKQVIEDVWQMEHNDIVAKHLDFSVRYKEPMPELILSDPVRLRQILLNLIDNAVKFTNNGSIAVHCEAVPISGGVADTAEQNTPNSRKVPNSALLRIEVIDTGIGIFKDDLEKIFEPLTQVDQSNKRRFGGNGLGLSIARRLAQLMDGDITVSSTPNKGSNFTLQLNVFLPNEEQAAAVLEKIRKKESGTLTGSDSSSSKYVNSQKTNPAFDGNVEKQNEEKDVAGQHPLKNFRILLVEDMLINQIVIATQLRDAGARVDIADNGKIAVDKINLAIDDGLFYDIVLMDMQMPVMDGYEAVSLLRSQGYTKPIIAITAHVLTGDKEKTIAAGCDNYIAKPVEKQILVNMVKKYVK
ncbi:MAG: ATP-binding protein [Planctomycetaceae bacterium]|nr:ATP-binding protein [Planctomycetaceae bacterium]